MKEVIAQLLGNGYATFVIRTIVILIVVFVLHFLIQKPLKKLTRKKKDEPLEEFRQRRTRIVFFRKFISAVLFVVALLYILSGISAFREFSYSIVAGAGVLALILGFGMQKTLSNIISGVSLAIYEPIRVGDQVKILGELGEVEDVSLRHTVITAWDNRRVIIPNSLIDEKEIINYSIIDDKILWTVEMGISYDSDINKAKKIILEHTTKHKSNLMNVIPKKDQPAYKPKVRVVKWADFSVVLRLYFWASDVYTATMMGYDLLESIKKDFDKKGIEIPYPYRTVVYKKDMK